MGHDRCFIDCCANDSRHPGRLDTHSNVTGVIKWYRLPKNDPKRKMWIESIMVSKIPGTSIPKYCYICSIHFVDGKPTKENPFPTLFLTPVMNCQKTPEKCVKMPANKRLCSSLVSEASDDQEMDFEVESGMKESSADESTSIEPLVALQFAHITRECDVNFFTGFSSTALFRSIFDFVKVKALGMKYWRGVKQVDRKPSFVENVLTSNDYDIDENKIESLLNLSRRRSKLTLEQEFLLVMMKLRLGLLCEDLAFRFCISHTKVSQIFSTWMKLLAKEIVALIIWPTKMQIWSTLPQCFKKLYPKVRTIIDCTEVFVETPSSLEAQANMWSDYKHHSTIKFLVAITPNGAISWISPCYGGRASDMFIVRDSGFLDQLQPYDQVMADRGFKMKTDLAMIQCTLCIPPSAAKGSQMLCGDVKKTSNIANVRIYVEQAIKRIKEYRILKNQIGIRYLPLVNDIVRVCGALCNLKEPLAN